MNQETLLIATTNQGKLQEIKHFFNDLSCRVICLSDLEDIPEDPEETEPTLEGNALLKATYYAEKTGYLTLADDTGLFIHTLDGWPGVKSARVAPPNEGQVQAALNALQGIPQEKRGAYFETIIAIHNPKKNNSHIFAGRTDGEILETPVTEDVKISYGYNRLFFVEEAQKTFAQMDLPEKNMYSQRGKALIKAKHFLENHYDPKQYVVPIGILVKDGQVLINKRHDPHNPEFHEAWEFPGGGIESEETIESALKREVNEETGYEVEIAQKINYIDVQHRIGRTQHLQIFLIPYICKIIGGTSSPNDAEVSESKWVDPDDVLSHTLVGNNKQLYSAILPAIHAYITSQA